jgi:hypothetical protein
MHYVAVFLCYLFEGSTTFPHVNCVLLDFLQAEKKDTVGVQEQVTLFGLVFLLNCYYKLHLAGFALGELYVVIADLERVC